MNKILEKITKENKICYLMGDFNIDLLKSESCDYANRFSEQLFTSSFIPLITKPTRITNHTATLIDNILTNDIEQAITSTNGLIFNDISDHLPIVHISNSDNRNEHINETNPEFRTFINNTTSNSFLNTIKNTSWCNVLTTENPTEEAFNEFSTIYTTAYESNFPLKQMTRKNVNKIKSPWMTNCIIKSVNKKNKLYKTYLIKPNETEEYYI